MKFLKILALAAVLVTSLTACLKDKSAEQTQEQTMEQAAAPAPTEGQPTEAAPADAAPAPTAE